MKTKLTLFLISSIIFTVLLSSCQSLPEPASSSDTLFVVNIDRSTEEGGSIFGTLVLTVAPATDPFDTTELSLNASKSFEFVQGLAPGTYVATALRWEYQETSRVQTYDPPTDAFSIVPGGLTIYPYRFSYEVTDGRMSFHWRRMNPAQRQQFVDDELAAEESFAAWAVK